MFVPNPLQLKAMLVGAGVMAIAILALTAWAFYERSRYFECQATAAPLIAQVQVLAGKIDGQNDAVQATAKAGQDALAETRKMLLTAGRLRAAADRAAEASEAIAKGPQQKGKDCRDAWREIEAAPAGANESGRAR